MLVAAALATGLIVAVVVLAGGGGDDDAVAAADVECLESWNSDPTAQALGRHQSAFHRYTSVEIMRLDVAGETFEPDPDGVCAVAYAAATVPRELKSAAQVLEGGTWVGLSSIDGVTTEVLGQLQEDAITGANAGLDSQGRLIPF